MVKQPKHWEPQVQSNHSINHAMRVILDVLDPLNIDLILMENKKKSAYLCVSVRGEDAELPSRPGQVEYMVSDGKPGHRSHGNSFENLIEAINHFNQIVEI